MRAAEAFDKQLNMVNGQIHIIVDGLGDNELVARPIPDANLIAYDLWHVIRTLDAEINALVRGVPEIATQAPVSEWPDIAIAGVGIGHTREEADAIGRNVQRAHLLAYADEVRASAHSWLKGAADEEFDAVPDLNARQASADPIYSSPAYHEYWPIGPPLNARPEKPVWLLLAGPCILHPWTHFGEIGLISQQLRQG
jgi:DinB superfamily